MFRISTVFLRPCMCAHPEAGGSAAAFLKSYCSASALMLHFSCMCTAAGQQLAERAAAMREHQPRMS
jgi:hypothetical protein